VVEGTPLLRVQTATSRGFESLPLRHLSLILLIFWAIFLRHPSSRPPTEKRLVASTYGSVAVGDECGCLVEENAKLVLGPGKTALLEVERVKLLRPLRIAHKNVNKWVMHV
jgi:hypothetical protein